MAYVSGARATSELAASVLQPLSDAYLGSLVKCLTISVAPHSLATKGGTQKVENTTLKLRKHNTVQYVYL